MDNWGWIYQLQNFADTLHITWDDALEKSVVEFFNVLAYLKDKNTFEAARQKEYLKKIRK